MQTSDIEAGKTYAYTHHLSRRNPPSVWSNRSLQPITVTEIRKESVKNRTTFGSRTVTVVVGTQILNGQPREVSVEPRYIICTWDEVKKARAEQANMATDAERTRLARYAELDPQIARLEQLLADAGVETSTDYLGVYYLHTVTGETTTVRPKEFDSEEDRGGWDYVNATYQTVLDREKILKSYGKVTLNIADVLRLIDGK